MKYFLGALLAVVAVALVIRLTQKSGSQKDLKKTSSTIVATQPAHNTVIEEVIQATSYTYLRVKEGEKDYWVATIKDDAKKGDSYSFDEALEMNNFTSKELNRTFPVIYFVSADADLGAGDMEAPVSMGKPKAEKKADEVIPQSPGGISVAELYKNRDQYDGKTVKVKGKVAKVNNEIMDRNWVHLQDGTSDSNNFDLTVTTQELVQVGDVVEFEGTISVNKDFGAGYSYDLIMEGAKRIK
jgi:hypothetical protein